MMFNLVINILFSIMLLYCSFTVLYLFVLSFAGKFFVHHRNVHVHDAVKKIAILVPAYKEDGIILSTAQNLIGLDYPAELFDVYIIADSFAENTLNKLRQLPLHVFEVHFENSTKTKSLNETFKRIEKKYDVALICDADNMLASDFLKHINNEFVKGSQAVQGRRVAKNSDTSFAVLDGCSEAINNHIFRKGTNAVGLSSAIIGSGMAFGYALLKNLLSAVNAVSGFDKILQLKIVEQGIKIQYLENALIFDEKVNSSHSFKQQRKRWLISQVLYLKQFLLPGFHQLFKGNLSYFNLAVANNIILPRAFMFFILPLLAIITFFIQPHWFFFASISLCILYILSLTLAIPSNLINKNLFTALLYLPKAILVMIGSLFGSHKAKNVFIHTIHTKTEINNPLYKIHGK